MLASRVYRYVNPAAVMIGLQELGASGLTPRGLLLIAIDPRGETHIAVSEKIDAVSHIKVGDKLALTPPWQGRFFHLDAVHRLPGDTVLWNGDRRLGDTGSAPEVACAVAIWLKEFGYKNVFLGCTAHQPGSWWTVNERSVVTDLHASGLTSTVVTQSGILARKIDEPHLYHLDFANLRRGNVREGWERVHTSSVGNVLMIERRMLNYRLVLSCVNGLVEIDVSGLPDRVVEVERVNVPRSIGVVGRIDGGPFAITTGDIEPWGFANIRPAVLIGAGGQSLHSLVALLDERQWELGDD